MTKAPTRRGFLLLRWLQLHAVLHRVAQQVRRILHGQAFFCYGEDLSAEALARHREIAKSRSDYAARH